MEMIAYQHLLEGMTVMMKIGSPARQWIRHLNDGSHWLTPVRYLPLSNGRLRKKGASPYIRVTVLKIKQPYAIVCHINGRRSVSLWIDLRDVPLYMASE